MKEAAAVGFTKEGGTLGEMYDVIRESDMSLLLISDAAFAENYKKIFATFPPACLNVATAPSVFSWPNV